MSRSPAPWIGAAEAARLLGVTRATLYAYVSRGYIRSEEQPGSSRARRYAREDVERLGRRAEARRHPDRAAARALRWGMPVLESAITRIADHRVYYRGYDATELARSHSVADVVALLWFGAFDAGAGHTVRKRRGLGGAARLPFVARAQAMLAVAAARDRLAFDLRPAGVGRTGWRILDVLGAAAGSRRVQGALDDRLASAWRLSSGDAALLRAAIILCADHELNVSTFTARCVASSGSHPYAVVLAGLAALEGTRHGGMTARVEAMLALLPRAKNPEAALADRLRRGEPIDGFGHPLYPKGDPRAATLLDLVRERHARSRELAFADRVAAAAGAVIAERPTVDFALVTLSRVLRLPAGSALTLFALGRTIGWIAHAIEQYADDRLIRPRAKYVGVMGDLRAPMTRSTPASGSMMRAVSS